VVWTWLVPRGWYGIDLDATIVACSSRKEKVADTFKAESASLTKPTAPLTNVGRQPHTPRKVPSSEDQVPATMSLNPAMPSGHQWAQYQQAVVDSEFGRTTLQVTPDAPGLTAGAFPGPPGSTIHVITAFNPTGRMAPDQDNHRVQLQLLAELERRGLTWWPAIGGDPQGAHTERSAAVLGLDDESAPELGQHYGQDTVFAWDAHSWSLLACTTGTVTVSGWRATEGGSVLPRAPARSVMA